MRPFAHRLFRLSLVLLLTVSAFAAITEPRAASAQGELPFPRNQTIVLEDTANYTVFDSFNPLIPNGNEFASGFIQVAQEALFLYNPASGKFEPWLAKSYEYNKDYTVLTVHLRDDVKWNDGQPFTADDVVFDIKLLMSSPKLPGNALFSEFVKDVTASDKSTVVITLTKPAPRFFYNLGEDVAGPLYIFPKHIWDGKDATTFKNNPPVTTSVWKLKQTLPDLRMFIWERDDNYWDKKEQFPAAKYIVYRQ